MPARNVRKQYLENSYYHIYNRGVEKRKIFLDEQDYNVFLSYLKEYLLPKDEKALYESLSDPNIGSIERNKILKLLRLNNFVDCISMLAYSLMPNHFHFLIRQREQNSMDKFMNSLGTRYTMFFNKKYKRVGSLYQDVYKAVLVKTDGQFIHLSRYIHKQALALQGDALQVQPSSYDDYIGKGQTPWLNSKEILSFFSTKYPALSYRSFVEEENDLDIISNILLEDPEF